MEDPRGFRFNSYNVIDFDENKKKLNNAYVKVLTGSWTTEQMIPMNEFVKIPPQTKKDFLQTEFARYL
jgi:hypothetical protein